MTPKQSQGQSTECGRHQARRLIEALKVLPVLGLVLFGMPLLWPDTGQTSDAMIYFFSVWLALVLAAAWLARRIGARAALRKSETEE